jgi:hypothetical protein
MGDVYRARDTTLDRDVRLSSAVACGDAEYMPSARMDRRDF